MTMTTTPVRPHALLVSTPFQGHINPLMRLGRRLAAKGVLVTFTTALRAAVRVEEDSDGHERAGFRFERLHGGGLWEPEDPRFSDAGDMARHVEAAGPAALKELIRREAEAGRPVTCVVTNAFVPWALRVAGELGLPCGMLWIQSCALLSVYYHYVHSLAAFPEADDDAPGRSLLVAIPGLPDLAMDELRPLLIYASDQYMWRKMLVEDLGGIRERVSWVFVNTFDELEHEAIAALGEHVQVIPVGPLIEPETDGPSDDDGCIAWLDAQAPRSVVFVAFGSLVKTDDDETAEIAEGLVSTGRPFLWVMRDDNRAVLFQGTLDGLKAATLCGRGKVVPWCKQAHVLAHGAIGCFVTHCGWNSTAEALAAGVPVVASPRWSDQNINAKFLVDVYRIGVRAPTPVTREALHLSIEEVMSGPEAGEMELRAASWKEKARAALAGGGSSDNGVQAFVDQIK
ncbi:Limonoid UDP-glucosyltransferase [Hordeum vulgare]|nr:Limonoid UDP-glucosyltransferase [Hordeum vulgare]